MHRWPVLLLFCLGISLLAIPALAAPSGQITPQPVEYTFGGQITLRADLNLAEPVSGVQVFLQSKGDNITYVGPATIQKDHLLFHHDLTTQPLRAFSVVEYWFRIQPVTGSAITSDKYSFMYEDNRFAWQTLSSESFTVHWYEGDEAFAQSVLNAAQAGLAHASELLELPSIQPMNIYVYATGVEMQSTLRLGGLQAVAGHADPDLGVAVVSLPAGPDQRSETDRQIPHEVLHLLLYQAVGENYYQLPVWLKEGLASANETRPNPDYYVILSRAVEEESLIPLASLCETFPQDNTVYLAYAEADSFVRYLFQQYGQAGIEGLVQSYAAGQGCENAPVSALGASLSELEQGWQRNALKADILGMALEALLPWGVLLSMLFLFPILLVLILSGRNRRLRLAQQKVNAPAVE